MLALLAASWIIEMATFSLDGRGHPPGWIAESLGSGLVLTLLSSIAWWVQNKRPRSLLPSLIVAVLLSAAMHYGRSLN